jgi:hypothetical protein
LEPKFKVNALAVLALTGVFGCFFMITKHEAALAAIIPFDDDPYDAIGSFCLIVSSFLSGISLYRAFRPYRPDPPAAINKAFLSRTLIAVPLGVLVTLVCDGIALARHPAKWTGKPATLELLALIAVLAALSIIVLFAVRQSALRLELPIDRGHTRKALGVLAVFVIILALFPEKVVDSIFPHFLAIVLCFVLIAASQRAWAVALLPYRTYAARLDGAKPLAHSRIWIQWGAISILGVAIGAFVLVQELFSDGAANAPLRQVLLVSAVFIGAGASCLLVAFAFLKKPLGLFQRAQ